MSRPSAPADTHPGAPPERYPDIPSLLAAERPSEPVYCLFPDVYTATARAFVDAFPGRVLYAVKANDHPEVLRALHAGGVDDFDCASLAEVAAVTRHCPGATPFFMIPVRPRGAAAAAWQDHGVRHFMIDQAEGLDALLGEIPAAGSTVFVRVSAHHASAAQDLSSKFGAPPGAAAELLRRVQQTGATPALACNVGSSVLDPEAYAHAVAVVGSVLEAAGVPVSLVDIGGGFPRAYPGFPVPPLEDYFDTLRNAIKVLPDAPGRQWLCEPGRALAAPGMSAVVEVLARKGDRLYVNDGMYGVFWELRFGMQSRYAARAWRDAVPLEGPEHPFTLFGPTCDSTDMLPAAVPLPEHIRPGDYLEFGRIGAYSLAGRTDFNGLGSDRVVRIDGPGERPPG